MSPENVKLAHAYFDEIAATSQEGLDPEATISKMAEFWDPEIEWDTSDGVALDSSGVYQGSPTSGGARRANCLCDWHATALRCVAHHVRVGAQSSALSSSRPS